MIDTITGTHPVYSRRRQEARAAWLGARTRNALRHPWKIATIGILVFVVALLGLVLAPRRSSSSDVTVAVTVIWRDTASLLARLDTIQQDLIRYDSLLTVRRAEATSARDRMAPVGPSPATTARRGGLESLLAELNRVLARAQSAPLADSYRAVGESPVFRDEPRMRQLLDTLADVEHERQEFDAGGGVDPIYVALTTRLNAVGRSIQALADAKRTAVRDEIARLPTLVAAPIAFPIARVDTVTPLVRRDAAQAAAEAARVSLAEARRANDELDLHLRRAREQANVLAPPVAILAAALVLGLTIGFATSFVAEVRVPRVADLQEVERTTGARVLAVVRPRDVPAERARRYADRRLPSLLDPTSDAYRLLTSHASVGEEMSSVVTIAGDVPAVTATIAANMAAVSVNDARSTLLVDTDVEGRAIPRVLAMEPAAGLSEILVGTIDWSAATRQIPVGRDRMLDVLPAGRDRHASISDDQAALIGREVARIARRYDLSIVVASLARAAYVRPTTNILVCAHVAHTPLAILKHHVYAMRELGAQVIGIVLWAADAPNLDASVPPPDGGSGDVGDPDSRPAFVPARRS